MTVPSLTELHHILDEDQIQTKCVLIPQQPSIPEHSIIATLVQLVIQKIPLEWIIF